MFVDLNRSPFFIYLGISSLRKLLAFASTWGLLIYRMEVEKIEDLVNIWLSPSLGSKFNKEATSIFMCSLLYFCCKCRNKMLFERRLNIHEEMEGFNHKVEEFLKTQLEETWEKVEVEVSKIWSCPHLSS